MGGWSLPLDSLRISVPRIVPDNLKTGVVKHPREGEVVLNDAYPTEDPFFNVHTFPEPRKTDVRRREYHHLPPPPSYAYRLLLTLVRRGLNPTPPPPPQPPRWSRKSPSPCCPARIAAKAIRVASDGRSAPSSALSNTASIRELVAQSWY